MRFCNRPGWLLLVLVAAGTSPAFSQDISWTQPYSGNIVYGPLAPSPGKLPNCPECDCETCQPHGRGGLLNRLFGGSGDRVRKCRREYYYCKQMYHTMYTPPVLPPYCEVGYGYYETSWRPACIATVPWDPTGKPFLSPDQGGPPPLPEIPAPSPADLSPEPDPKSNLRDELEQETKGTNPVPSPPGDEKPRYEDPTPKPDAAAFQFPQDNPLSERMPIISPR